MPGYWLVKTGPSTYSFDDLNREGVATWDGVKNPVAMKHLRAMRPGEEVLIYHTGNEKSEVEMEQLYAAVSHSRCSKLGPPHTDFAPHPLPQRVSCTRID